MEYARHASLGNRGHSKYLDIRTCPARADCRLHPPDPAPSHNVERIPGQQTIQSVCLCGASFSSSTCIWPGRIITKKPVLVCGRSLPPCCLAGQRGHGYHDCVAPGAEKRGRGRDTRTVLKSCSKDHGLWKPALPAQIAPYQGPWHILSAIVHDLTSARIKSVLTSQFPWGETRY